MPSCLELVDKGVEVLSKAPLSAFALSELLQTLVKRNNGNDRNTVIKYFHTELEKASDIEINEYSDFTNLEPRLNALTHLLALLLSESIPSREDTAELKIVEVHLISF